jgi:hypothetical protein
MPGLQRQPCFVCMACSDDNSQICLCRETHLIDGGLSDGVDAKPFGPSQRIQQCAGGVQFT